MQEFVDYYNANKKQYTFTIKIAANDLSSDAAAKLERYLERYNLVSFNPFTKTPIQQSPLDFPNVKDSEVYITEIVVEYPATPNALLREISSGLNMSESNIAVYTENDPRHEYTEQWLERMVDTETFKANYKPFLGNLEKWPEEPAYGEKYNTDFLKTLQKVSDSKKDNVVTNSLIPAQKIDKGTASKVEFDGEGTTAVLNDRFRNATEYSPKKKVTMMSKPGKDK